MNEGWLCPKCQSAHAPDVKTCPTYPAGVLMPFSQISDCACPPNTTLGCPNSACPRRPYKTTITVTAQGKGTAP